MFSCRAIEASRQVPLSPVTLNLDTVGFVGTSGGKGLGGPVVGEGPSCVQCVSAGTVKTVGRTVQNPACFKLPQMLECMLELGTPTSQLHRALLQAYGQRVLGSRDDPEHSSSLVASPDSPNVFPTLAFLLSEQTNILRPRESVTLPQGNDV